MYGKVKYYDVEKGYGFIAPDGGGYGDIFFPATELMGGYAPQAGDRVEYQPVGNKAELVAKAHPGAAVRTARSLTDRR
jgi:cold shock CspA family protein